MKLRLSIILAAASGLAVFSAGALAAQDIFTQESEYSFAQELYMDSDYRLAENVFRSIEAARPDTALSGDAAFMAAEAEYGTGRYTKALRSYIGIIEKNPETKNKYKKELYYRLAECYFQLKDADNSIKYINILLSSYPGSYLERDLYLLLGEDMLMSGQYDRAIDALNRLENYTNYEHFDYVYYLLGRTYYEKILASPAGEKQKNADASLKYFSRIKNEFPESKILNHAQFWAANVYYATGQYKRALEAAKTVLDREKDEKFRLLIRYFIAWNYYMSGDYRQALAGYDSIISGSSGDVLSIWSQYKEGMCYEAQNDPARALAQYNMVVEKYPSTIPAAYAAYAAAYYYYKQKNYGESLARFQKLNSDYDVEELNRAAWFMTAEIYTATNDLTKAMASYESIELKYPDDALRARFMKAWCYFRQGDFQKSIDTYELVRGSAKAPADLKSRSTLKIGDDYFEMDNMTEAEKKYDEVLNGGQADPDITAEAYYAKGWVDYRKNDYKNARMYFGRSKSSARSAGIRIRADFMDANTMYSAHDFDGALAVYNSILQNQSADGDMKADSIFYSGWCQYRKENFDAAIALWESYGSSVADPVKQAEAVYRIGWAYFRKNDFDTAAAKFGIILDKYKTTHLYQEALLKSGDCYYNKKDYNKAISFYKEIVDRFPQHYRVGEALYGIQWSYYQLGEDDKAIELSKQFVDKYPESSFTPEIQYRIAEHYYNTGKYPTAVDEFNKFLDKYPAHELADNAYYWLGISYFNSGHYNEAISTFKGLNTRFPSNPFADKAVFKIAAAYYKLRGFDQAVVYFTMYIDKYKDSSLADSAYFNLAMSYKRLDRTEDAKKWYIKLTEDFKNSELTERSMMNLGYIFQDGKQYDDAITWFRKAVDAGGKKAVEAQFWIADCMSSKGDLDGAAEEYLNVYKNFKADEMWAVSALDAAGKIYEKQEKLKKAIAVYEKITGITKNPKYTEAAKKRIELLQEQYNLLHPAGPRKVKQ